MADTGVSALCRVSLCDSLGIWRWLELYIWDRHLALECYRRIGGLVVADCERGGGLAVATCLRDMQLGVAVFRRWIVRRLAVVRRALSVNKEKGI